MAIEANIVMKLREETGAGMMDCKKALAETNGDFEAAKDLLRKKGEAKAAKRVGRATGQGRIGSYIHHNSKIGVLVEVRTESDFVASNEVFLDFVKTVCMQVAATAPRSLSKEDLDPKIVERERSIYAESEDVISKPEKVRPKIVEGKMSAFYKSACLLEQPLVTDESKTVEALLKETIAKFGENIRIVRFVRLELGETD